MIGAGRGDDDADEAIAVSRTDPGILCAACGKVWLLKECRCRARDKGSRPDVLPTDEPGDGGGWRPGDEASEPALKGWKETDCLRGIEGAASCRREDFRSKVDF